MYGHFSNLRSAHSEDSDSKLLISLNRHQGRKVGRFFCRAASRLSATFFWRSISLWGYSCSCSLIDPAIAARTCTSSPFENMTSPKVFRKEERKRLNEYCESSQRDRKSTRLNSSHRCIS